MVCFVECTCDKQRGGGGGGGRSLCSRRYRPFVYQIHSTKHRVTIVHDTSNKQRERERDIFYLTTHSTPFMYGYMASDI